ncbi:MAG: cytochrome b/b6 domain-containing protein [Gemmatimonadetes bacterium]|nr:cytochrome b/b6 domain-containing protein [Gemmatimonadota bacterium]MBP7549283.1 cytochrome b/b6 domain-containing protein [Gemmatimonadaceae bacterium]
MTTISHRHHWIVRATHWVNAVAFLAMVGSGLRIFNAYPAFARRGESFPLNPWEGTPIPSWLTFGAWLGGARHWHFAMMWVLVANAFVYLAFIYLHGEWRDLVPRRGTLRDAWAMVRFYLWLEREHPRQGKHNALQRMAYFSMPWMAAVIVVTGIAIWKPVSLGWLAALFGGYAYARFFHFMAMVVLLVAALGHVFMVFAVDPFSLRGMITGGYDESRSPEARNARPFVNLLRRGATVSSAAPAPSIAAAPTQEPDA